MMNSTQITKAIQATIYLGNIPLDVYHLPDGSYKLYAESVTNVIDRSGRDLLNFLRGKSIQALPFKDYNLVHAPRVEVEGRGGFIKAIPVKLATAYWLYRAIKGNILAQAPWNSPDITGQPFRNVSVPPRSSVWFEGCPVMSRKNCSLASACMMESIERRADKVFSIKRTEADYNRRFDELWSEILAENKLDVQARRLPGDDLYLPPGIN